MDNKSDPNNWERNVLEKVLMASLEEQRRSRRWKIFFRLVVLIYILVFVVALIWPTSKSSIKNLNKPHAAIVNITGIIAPKSDYSAYRINRNLNRAFKDKKTLGVILNINSPGGTPVQADLIYENIMRLRKKYPHTKIYAVCSDVCASGAYYIAASANDIYTNRASLVGSIGVMINSFGFTQAMEKLGIQRRLIIAGRNKGILDPFSPMNTTERNILQHIVDETHRVFIDKVKQGRGKRLKLNTPDLFSGSVWTGEDAKKIGLIDGFLTIRQVARLKIGTKYTATYRIRQNWLRTLSRSLGTEFADSMLSHLTAMAKTHEH